ncbi:MAG: hypothetical protein AAFX65_13585 [Cyanobacteria bacterium J06638_7]
MSVRERAQAEEDSLQRCVWIGCRELSGLPVTSTSPDELGLLGCSAMEGVDPHRPPITRRKM